MVRAIDLSESMSRALSRLGARRLGLALAVLVPALTLAVPCAFAEEETVVTPDSGELALEGIGKLMKALELFIDAIPQYGAPYVDDNGNIVIPRIGDPAAPIPADPPVEETGTTT
jgi:hypothetical protein